MKTESRKPKSETRMAATCSLMVLGTIVAISPLRVHADEPAASTQPSAIDDEQKELSKKLIGGGGPDGNDVMAVVLSLMERSQERLTNAFDPGAQTQAVQKDIIKQLDAAILSARRQKRSSGAPQPSSSDKRTAESQPDTKPKDAEAEGTAVDDAAQTSAASAAGKSSGAKGAGELRETRRQWGHLPTRDRDEMLQSGGENVLPRFQTLVDKYFQALAETEQDQP